MVSLLLAARADPSTCNAGRQETPLHLAARDGQTAIVTMLLQAGADANACDVRRATPLQHSPKMRKILSLL